MSGELSGMVYDRPMTENQSVIEEIAMINCGEKRLKSLLNWPLTVGSGAPTSAAVGLGKSNPAIHSFILDPAIQSGRIPVKRLRIRFVAAPSDASVLV